MSTTSEIYGCASARTRALTRSDLSPAVRARIRGLQRIEPMRNARRLAGFVLIGGLGEALLLSTAGVLVHAAGTALVVAALVGLSVLMHEGCHHLLFRSRALSRAIGFCCGAPVLISVSAYRTLHLRHHAFERTDRDPDDVERLTREPHRLVLLYYALLVAGTYLYIPHVAATGCSLAGSRRVRSLILLEYAVILVLLGTFAAVAPSTFLRAWVVPMLLAAQITSLRSIAEHGLTSSGSPFTASRSVLSNRLVSFCFCNLNYHLEHHLFPAVPWYNLPTLHRLLLPAYRETGASVYRSYRAFFLDFLRTSWAGVIPNVRLLPQHLREEVCG